MNLETAELDRRLTDPGAFASEGVPWEVFRELRATDPVHWTEGHLSRGFWSVTRHADIQSVLRDPDTFSSERNGMILPVTREAEKATPESKGCGIVMFNSDEPRHRDIRVQFDRVWSVSEVRRVEDMTRRIIREVLAAAAPQGQCDFVRDVAMRIPVEAICELMGVPIEDVDKILGFAHMAMFPADPEYNTGDVGETSMRGFALITEYCTKLALQRRETPTDDVSSVVGNLRLYDHPLTDAELGWNASQFVLGGLETTRNALSGGVLMLMEHPDQFELLRSDPSLIPGAVEETLRWVSPGTHLLRTATKAVELGGKQIQEDDWVVLWLCSGNHDEAVFEKPEAFDITRNASRHVAFGHGPHFCIGRNLARMEMRIFFEELGRALPNMRLAGPVERVASNQLAGIKSMPITFTPSTPGYLDAA